MPLSMYMEVYREILILGCKNDIVDIGLGGS